jgi:hypothetical protein
VGGPAVWLSDFRPSSKVVYVNADPVARNSAPLPDFLRKVIKAFEHTAPAELNGAPA